MSTSLHLSLREYDRMVVRGAFDELNRRIELIRGEIRELNPAGPVHDDYIEYLKDWSYRVTDRKRIQVRGQTGLSIAASESRPEPDVFWVVSKRYLERHPTEKDLLLVIEAAESSLNSDMSIKSAIYAEAKIQEYWVVDVIHQCIHVMREPGQGQRYHAQQTLQPGQLLSPVAQPDAALVLADLFSSL